MPTPSLERVRAVLDDLYAIDPALREYGTDLEDAVRTLLASKPDVDVNSQFVASLRKKLIQPAPVRTSFSLMPKFSLPMMIPVAAVGVIAVVAAMVVTQPGLLRMNGGSPSQPNTNTLALNSLTVTKVGANGFGNLAHNGGAGEDASMISARPQSGGGGPAYGMGGGGTAMAVPAPAMAPLADGATEEQEAEYAKRMANTSMIAPGEPGSYTYERFRYSYDGTLPELASSVDVFRRVKQSISAGSLANTSIGFMNLGSFGNTKLQQFTLTQGGSYGYQIYVDLNEGMVNINQDWNSWPHPEALPCVPEGPCGYQMESSDVPEDGVITGIADAFLSEHGISKDSYGAPVVDRRWSIVQPYMRGTPGALTTDMRVRWAPDTMNVVYPVQINGMTAYDSSGFPYGLSVTVSIREKKVTSVWNLMTLQYESSAYDALTDAKLILDIASRGDVYSAPFGQDSAERIIDRKLGEPTIVLMQSWHQTSNGMGEEILVPALRFPIVKDGETNDYRDAVMVPLVKELAQPIYTIMEKGMGGGVLMNQGTTATPPPATTDPAVVAPAPAVMPKQ
jgi:hypothetical protein